MPARQSYRFRGARLLGFAYGRPRRAGEKPSRGEPMLKTLTPPTVGAVGEQEFRDALRLFASGVTVITAPDGEGGVHGMTATAFSSLSLRPPLVLVAVARDTRCHRLIAAGKRFGISILYDQQTEVSRHFGKQGQADRPPRFASLDDVPVIEGSMAMLACSLEESFEGGDHSIFVGLVSAAQARPGSPLLHFDGRYRTLDVLS